MANDFELITIGAASRHRADFGPIHLEATVAWGLLDFYVEAEYARDSREGSAAYTYAWNELGLHPVEWVRFGVAF